MGSVFSRTVVPANPCGSRAGGGSGRGNEGCSCPRAQQQQLFSAAATKERFRFQSKMARELGLRVHEAISQRDLELLRTLVCCQGASVERNDDRGMTPLRSALHAPWTEGALFLLDHGVDVYNADVSPQCHCPSQSPLVKLALAIRSLPLLKKLIKEGLSVRVKDIRGEYYYHDPWVPSGSLFRCLADVLTEDGSKRPELLKDMFFAIRTGKRYGVDPLRIEEFIKRQPECYQGWMFQVYAACHCNGSTADLERALHYWRMSAGGSPRQPQDQAEEEESAPRSVFADILPVRDHALPNTATTREDQLTVCIHALLVIERFMSEDELLTWTGLEVFFRLLGQGNIVTAIGVFCRLTTVRTLSKTEVVNIMVNLAANRKKLEDAPFVALSESMTTIKNCIASALEWYGTACMMCKEAFDASDVYRTILQVFCCTTTIFYSSKVPPTPDQLETFASHINQFVRIFPWSLCPYAFYELAKQTELFPSPASMVNSLVATCAEVFGTVRVGTFPPHLQSTQGGDTPLHYMARYRSRQDLVQGGVLQYFLDHGADLCTKNGKGESVRGILLRRGVCSEGDILPSLQCLAAAAFMSDEHLRQNVGNYRPAAVRNFLLHH